ncbi:MAG: C-glycoside deglycosidase beta subunit domain-containing protein [Promethearchaeota archaeon]
MPKYIVKRILPMDAVSNVDTTGDGKPDHIQVVSYNVMLPISVAEINSWNLRLEEAGELFVDDEKVDPTTIKAYFEGKEYTIDDFYDQNDLVIPIGARAKILIPREGGLPVGKHTFRVKYSWEDFSGDVQLEREITEDRVCLPFSPTFD